MSKVKQKSSKIKPKVSDDERLRRALAVIRQAVPLDKLRKKDTDAARVRNYLRRRGIKYVPENVLVLKRDEDHGTGMVFPVIDKSTNHLSGCHITFLDRVKNPRRQTLGHTKGGVSVMGINDDPGPLLIAEGNEDAMSVHDITGYESWSALSSGNMKVIAIPVEYRDIIICADNDKAGLEGANALAQTMAMQGRKVRLAIPPEEGDDWNDLLNDDEYDRKKLKRMILRADIVKPTVREFGFISVYDFTQLEFPPVYDLLSPWLPAQGSAFVHAWRGTGKTWFTLSVAFAVAHEGEFLGFKGHGGDVMYLDGEMNPGELQKRIEMLLKLFPQNSDDTVRIMSAIKLAGEGIAIPDLGTTEGQAVINAQILPGTRLIIVDSKSSLVRTGSENDATGWQIMQDWINQNKAQGISTLVDHHDGKGHTQRGWSGHEDHMNTVIKLKQPDGWVAADGCVFEVIYEKSRSVYGPGISPIQAKLIKGDETGEIRWEQSEVGDTVSNAILKYLDENPDATHKEIAKAIGVSPQWVGQIRKKLKPTKRQTYTGKRRKTYGYDETESDE